MTTTVARMMARIGFAMLVASMLAMAVALAQIEFLTAALVAGVAGIGTDVRLTQEFAVAR